jgi:hypothetical protein
MPLHGAIGFEAKLERLIDLKLACAMTVPYRFRGIHDVVQLIRKDALPWMADSSPSTPTFVRSGDELWDLAQHVEEEY